MQLAVEGPRGRVRQPLEREQILDRGATDRGDTAELAQEPCSCEPDRGRALRRARSSSCVAAEVAVIADRETVRLVTDPLQEEESIRPAGDPHRIGTSRPEHLLEAFCERSYGDLVGEAEALEHADPDSELTLSAVEEEQLRRVRELPRCLRVLVRVRRSALSRLEQRRESPRKDLVHRCVVVVSRDIANLEAPVLRRPRQSVFEHDHRAHVVGSLKVAHVEALDPQRCELQTERLLERLQSPRLASCGPAPASAGAS